VTLTFEIHDMALGNVKVKPEYHIYLVLKLFFGHIDAYTPDQQLQLDLY